MKRHGWISGKEALPPGPGNYEVCCVVQYINTYEGLQWGSVYLWDGDFYWRPAAEGAAMPPNPTCDLFAPEDE